LINILSSRIKTNTKLLNIKGKLEAVICTSTNTSTTEKIDRKPLFITNTDEMPEKNITEDIKDDESIMSSETGSITDNKNDDDESVMAENLEDYRSEDENHSSSNW